MLFTAHLWMDPAVQILEILLRFATRTQRMKGQKNHWDEIIGEKILKKCDKNHQSEVIS